jgi:opacity protein-like surface antigen
MRSSSTVMLVVFLSTGFVVTPGAAQTADDVPAFAVEVFGGAATFARFVEQRVTDATGGERERELTASTALAVGGALNLRLWEKTTVRVGFTYSPTELEFEDDSGTGEGAGAGAGEDGLRDLNLYAGSVSLLRLLGPADLPVRPYAVGGVAGGWWSLEDTPADAATAGLIVGGDDETQFRLGALTGIGLQLRVAQQVLVRLEASRLTTRNPFDGEDALRVTAGGTFDEPETVGVNRFSLGLAWAFGGG